MRVPTLEQYMLSNFPKPQSKFLASSSDIIEILSWAALCPPNSYVDV